MRKNIGSNRSCALALQVRAPFRLFANRLNIRCERRLEMFVKSQGRTDGFLLINFGSLSLDRNVSTDAGHALIDLVSLTIL